MHIKFKESYREDDRKEFLHVCLVEDPSSVDGEEKLIRECMFEKKLLTERDWEKLKVNFRVIVEGLLKGLNIQGEHHAVEERKVAESIW